MIKIRLYTPVTLFGFLICLFTQSKYSHATIEINGVMYDSSESRGFFDVSTINNEGRIYQEYALEGNLTYWVLNNLGRRYDWVGVLGWIFNFNDKNKFYCFEVIYEALVQLKMTKPYSGAVSANTLIPILEKYKSN